jgi:hypothetical protein
LVCILITGCAGTAYRHSTGACWTDELQKSIWKT